jgi:ribosomal protein S18 acetylase RimI-like enzyme
MIETRKIKPADARAVRALYLALLRGTFPHFPPEAIEKYAADWTAEVIAERAAAGAFLLLGAFKTEGEAAGLLFGAPPDSGVGTVIWLGVAEGCRGAGLGAKLMRAAFADYQARGCHKVKVYTETEAAQQFYLRLGLELEGFHPRHWWKVGFWSLGIQL